MKKYKVGCIQSTPVIFNIEKTVNKTLSLMTDVAGMGCKLAVFPETFIPGYPAGLGFGTVVGSRTEAGFDQFQEYWENSIEVGDKYTQKLGEHCKKLNIFLVIGVTEKDSVSKTLYCTILYFGPNGRLLGKHRKIKPTAAERLVWGEGDGTTLVTYNTELGRLGGLICWENYMPLARMAMYKKGLDLYFAPTADARDSWQSTMVHIACEGKCYVIGCNQYFTKSDYPEHLQTQLAKDRPEILSRGGSVIVSPDGKVLAGPLYNEEGILTAEIDLNLIARNRMAFNVIGHYSRDDIFKFKAKGQPDIEYII